MQQAAGPRQQFAAYRIAAYSILIRRSVCCIIVTSAFFYFHFLLHSFLDSEEIRGVPIWSVFLAIFGARGLFTGPRPVWNGQRALGLYAAGGGP